jgi:serine protease Do
MTLLMRSRIFGWGLCVICLATLTESRCPATEARQTALVKAVHRAEAAVVNIHTEKTTVDKDSAFTQGQGRKINGMGSGIVVDERGYILTNHHVIADVDAAATRVTLFDGSTYKARVISYDRRHDLAVIKIDPSRSLPTVPLGTSSDIMLGETVIAIGNAFGYEHTVTAGIVSALSRDVEVNEHQDYKNLIQTDASINPGNSGGPLINLDGEVVGINVAIRAGAQRIGFAIPMDDARRLLAKLLNPAKLSDTYHGLIGRDEKSAREMKFVVDGTESNSPASSAGFQSGDIVLQVGSVKVTDQADAERAMLGYQAGQSIDSVVRRGTERLTLTMKLARHNTAQAVAGTQPQPQAVVPAETSHDKCWKMAGMKLEPAQRTQLGIHSTRYRGGMRVLEIRGESPSAKAGIRQGDILVGLHQWETISQDNMSYIFNHKQLATFGPLKFYVLRGAETLYGNVTLPVDGK